MATVDLDVPFEHVDFVSRALEAIRDVLLRGKSIDLRAAEPDKSEAAHEALLRTIVPLLDETYAIISRVGARFEEDEDDRERVDAADIIALAGMALQQRRTLLTHAQPCDHWTFLENCERSLRSLAKSASVVEGALSRYDHLPARLDRAAELAASLAVRRRYATLRREVWNAGRGHQDLKSRLLAASRGIAALLNSTEYSSMRIGDRRELRMLQFRLQSWLSSEYPAESIGARTWEEVIAVVALLGGISQRSELVAHDLALLAGLVHAIERGDDTRQLREGAEPLFGLDLELDRLLDLHSADGLRLDCWTSVITRLAIERGVAPPAGQPHDSISEPFSSIVSSE
ncbi:MAG: hypothetical protein JO197_06925 [Acidobacteria bacterium]|nr:hypothetical protein [Acidobacteriota bacterium]MBV9477587.1 hypothetical protein [Acidobacteriota bacterium]